MSRYILLPVCSVLSGRVVRRGRNVIDPWIVHLSLFEVVVKLFFLLSFRGLDGWLPESNANVVIVVVVVEVDPVDAIFRCMNKLLK